MPKSNTNFVLNNIHFTPREWDVLACIKAGHTASKEIARLLSASPRTIETHIAHILIKTQTTSRHQITGFLKNTAENSTLSDLYQTQINPGFKVDPPKNELSKGLTSPIFTKKNIIVAAIILVAITLGMNYKSKQIQPQITNIPGYLAHSKNLERTPFLLDIKNALMQNNKRIPIVALLGPGGSGKTTLAVQYAHSAPYSLIWRVQADNSSTLLNSFINLAETLAEPNQADKVKEIKNIECPEEKEHRAIDFVYEKLNQKKPWLLIFENANNIKECRSFLPKAGLQGGGLLITTRDQNAGNFSFVEHVISVKELSLEEAAHLFLTTLGQGPNTSEEDKKNNIAKLLQHIPPYPLDISIAARYINDTKISVDQYIEKINSNQSEFLQHEEKLWQNYSGYQRTRHSIVSVAINKMLEENPHYIDNLILIALVHHDKIPYDFLDQLHPSIPTDSFIHDLRRFSLIISEASEGNHKFFSVHASTRRIIYDALLGSKETKEKINHIFEVITTVTRDAIKKQDDTLLNLLAPQLGKISSHYHLCSDTMLKENFMLQYAWLCHHLRQYKTSERIAHALLQEAKSINQKDNTIRVYLLLGRNYLAAFQMEEAVKILEEGISWYNKHKLQLPQRLLSMRNSLAEAYNFLGEAPKAKKICEETLKSCETKPSYDIQAEAMMVLANIYLDEGNYTKAKEQIDRSIEIYQTHLPYFRTELVRALVKKTFVLFALGLNTQAIEYAKETLSTYSNELAPNHPSITELQAILGGLYRRKGDLEEATKYLHQKWPDDLPSLGYCISHEKAHIAIQEKDYKSGLTLAKQCYEITLNAFGPNHFRTLVSLSFIGYIRALMGDYDQAEEILGKALQDLATINHPYHGRVLDYLSELYRQKTLNSRKDQDKMKEKALECNQKYIETIEKFTPKDLLDSSEHMIQAIRQKERILKTSFGKEDLSIPPRYQ